MRIVVGSLLGVRGRFGGCVVGGGVVAAVWCGLAGAVVGGRAIGVASAPWSVSVAGPAAADRCTGAIIDPTHIVTAAHCVYSRGGVWVRAGGVRVGAGVSNSLHPRSGVSDRNRSAAGIRGH